MDFRKVSYLIWFNNLPKYFAKCILTCAISFQEFYDRFYNKQPFFSRQLRTRLNVTIGKAIPKYVFQHYKV